MDTVIRFCKRFFFDLWHALLFAAQDYDLKLRETKTSMERMLMWGIIICLTLFVLAAFVYGIWHFLDSIEVTGFI